MTAKPRIVISVILLVISGAVSWRIQHRGSLALEETQAKLQGGLEELARLQETSTDLSNFIKQGSNRPQLSDSEFRELLKLRGKVGQLLAEHSQGVMLAASNQSLSAALPKATSPLLIESHWTREQLNDAGYENPEAAVVTTLWALNHEDTSVQVSVLSPEDRAALEAASSKGIPVDATTFCRKLGELVNPPSATGIHLVSKKVTSPNEVFLDVYYEGEGKTRQFRMIQIDGSWKVADLISITAH